MKYDHYRFEDFVLDEYFIQWVLSPDEESNTFWEKWRSNNPDKEQEIKKAVEYILNLHQDQNLWTSEESSKIWENIEEETQNIDERERNYSQRIYHSKKGIPYFWRVAATLLLLIGVTLVLRYFYEDTPQLIRQTEYGEIREIWLPDSSLIILNSNSRVIYADNIDQEKIRRVELQGEAYFSVKHTIDHRKFIVETQNIAIEVLGTEFNVNSRRDETEVVLSEGKVKVATQIKKDTTQVILNPGEMVKLASAEKSIVKKQVDPYQYSSWRDNKLILEETPISQIAKRIEDNYGVKIIISNTELSNRKVTGTILSDNLDVLLKALSTTSNIQVVRDRNHIILKNK